MLKSIFLLISCFPVILFAQKGTIIPDVKPQSSVNTANDTKMWIIEDYLLSCVDSTRKCYLVKENGINKTVPVKDVYDFFYEEGTKYTVWVKEELKTPPINSSEGIYKYTVVKIASKNNASSTAIPSVTSNTPVTIPTNETSLISVEEKSKLEDEITGLKKQIAEVKKQMELMQLQLEMQLKLMDRK